MPTQVQNDTGFTTGPISGPILGLLGAVCTAQLGRVAEGFPEWTPLLFALLGIVAAVAVGRRRRVEMKNIIFRCACWAASAIWAFWTILQGWSWIGAVILIAGAVFTGLLSPAFAADADVPTAQQQQPPPQDPVGQSSSTDLYHRLLMYGIMKTAGLTDKERPTITKVADWPLGTGHTWRVVGAVGSTFNWTKLRDVQVQLAAILRLPRGCPINAEPDTQHQGAALLHISTVNDMHKETKWPEDYTPRSVRDPFEIGLFLNKAPTLVELYQAAGLVAGQRGGGKTVFLQGMTAALATCIDTVIMHVDLNGGGMSAPWATPHALGLIDEPIIDWIATTPAEALLMAEVLTAVAKDRKRRYQRLLIENNTDVLPVSAQIPAIIVIVDEGGEVMGEDATKEAKLASQALRELQRIGRAMCVNVVFSTQRATADYVPSSMKKAVGWSICTRVGDDAELAYVFDWKKGLSSEDLLHPGQAYIRVGSGPVKMFKGHRLLPAQITEISLATWRRRPKLDAPAVAVGGKIYAGRYSRPDILQFMAGLRGEEIELKDAGIDPDTSNRSTPPPAPGLGSAQDAINMMNAAISAARAKKEQQPAPAQPADDGDNRSTNRGGPSPVLTMGDDELNRQFLSLAAQLDDVAPDDVVHPDAPPARFLPGSPAAQQAPPAETGPPTPASRPAMPSAAERYKFIVELVDQAGPDGIKTEEVIEKTITAGYTRRPQTVKETLTEARTAGHVIQPPGSYARWWGPRYAAS